MSDWTRVKWTEARQIAEALELEPEEWPDARVTPQQGLALFLKQREAQDAIQYLGQALPRFEAVAWAAHEVGRQPGDLAPLQRQAMDRVLRWLGEPTEDFRLAVRAAGDKAKNGSPEQILAQAVFFSGGSMSEPDLPAVLPPLRLCGRFAAAAVILSCLQAADPAAAMQQAIASGNQVAAGGIEAVSAA